MIPTVRLSLRAPSTRLCIFAELISWQCPGTQEAQRDVVQVEGYVNGTFNLAKNLPEELAALPKNVSFCAHNCLDMSICASTLMVPS